MLSLFKRWLRYSMVRKGGSSPMWTAIGVLSVLNTLRKKYTGPKTTTILSDGIRPGEVIEIRHTGKPSKDVRSERASKAALLAQLRAADAAPGRPSRPVRQLHKKLGGTVIAEMASGKSNSTTVPVTKLVAAAASALSSSDAVTSRRQLRKATKAASTEAKRSAKAAR